MRLEADISTIKGIGPRRAEALQRLGLFSIRDILFFAPRAYEDYSRIRLAAQCVQGENVALHVRFLSEPTVARPRGGLHICSQRAADASENLRLVWYNKLYGKAQTHEGEQGIACGRVDKRHGFMLVNPTLYDTLPGILPVYPLCRGLTQRVLRDTIKAALAESPGEIVETLPETLRDKYRLCTMEYALQNLHFPKDLDALSAAKRRLAFEDMLVFRLMLSMLGMRQRQGRGIAFSMEGMKARFMEALPFSPTAAQNRVMDEIASDMAQKRPMNRLLQGDVGSGKTIPALFCIYAALQNGYQAVFLAPTEILAEQHFSLLQRMFGDKACILKGNMKKAERDAALAAIADGNAMAITGTHALLQESVVFFRLGMVIADEQHRFGVLQRAMLSTKGEVDMLIMSATPIPRTLSLLLYGDLDLSVLDELPPGRKPIQTRLVPLGRREDMYRFIENEVKKGKQAYVVCPLVEPSEAMAGLLSAESLYAELNKKLSVRIGLLHGRMPMQEKARVTAAFRDGAIDILISTTVIEVGVDVQNATIMAIENADRFGLAQLHQLRGRVGRGNAASYCFLLSESHASTARERLDILTKTQNGFIIAEKDLAIRGPGEMLGARQHGMAEFMGMGLAMDMEVLQSADKAAKSILSDSGLQMECATLLHYTKDKLRLRISDLAMN